MPVTRRMAGCGRRRYDLTSRARQVRVDDLSRFDLILAMDRQNLADLRRLPGAESAGDRLSLFGAFCTRHEQDEVPDPYYGGEDGFELVLDLLEDGCAGILRRWEEGQWR